MTRGSEKLRALYTQFRKQSDDDVNELCDALVHIAVKNRRIAELDAKLKRCKATRTGIIRERDAGWKEYAEQIQENARLLRELETICVVKNAQWGEVYAKNAKLREELAQAYRILKKSIKEMERE